VQLTAVGNGYVAVGNAVVSRFLLGRADAVVSRILVCAAVVSRVLETRLSAGSVEGGDTAEGGPFLDARLIVDRIIVKRRRGSQPVPRCAVVSRIFIERRRGSQPVPRCAVVSRIFDGRRRGSQPVPRCAVVSRIFDGRMR
jgi:hypothetical protein